MSAAAQFFDRCSSVGADVDHSFVNVNLVHHAPWQSMMGLLDRQQKREAMEATSGREQMSLG